MHEVVGRGFLKPENFEKILDENPWLGEIEIANYGEIFLNPGLPEILKCAHERRVVLRAETGANLNNVKEEALECLVPCNIYNFG